MLRRDPNQFQSFDNFQASPYNWSMKKSLKDFIKPGSEEDSLVNQIDFSHLPSHVAVKIFPGSKATAPERNLFAKLWKPLLI